MHTALPFYHDMASSTQLIDDMSVELGAKVDVVSPEVPKISVKHANYARLGESNTYTSHRRRYMRSRVFQQGADTSFSDFQGIGQDVRIGIPRSSCHV